MTSSYIWYRVIFPHRVSLFLTLVPIPFRCEPVKTDPITFMYVAIIFERNTVISVNIKY